MNWQENFLSFVNVYFSQLFSGGPKKQRNILVPFHVAMVVEGGGGASQLHFITSKNPNIFYLGGEVAIIWSFTLSICFIKLSLIMFWFMWSKTYLWTLKYLYSFSSGGRGKVNGAIFILSAVFFILMASLINLYHQ